MIIKIIFIVMMSATAIIISDMNHQVFSSTQYQWTLPNDSRGPSIQNCPTVQSTSFLIINRQNQIHAQLKISELPPHYELVFDLDFYQFDFQVQALVISIDSEEYQINYDQSPINLKNICFKNQKDYLTSINFKTLHSSINFQIDIQSKQFEQDFLTGIRNLNIEVKQCHYTCKTCNGPSKDNCLSCYEGVEYKQTTKTCQCQNKLLADRCYQFCPSKYQQKGDICVPNQSKVK